ncbi:MAG: hypothetical protein WAU68_16500 [Vitreimonas sp.]
MRTIINVIGGCLIAIIWVVTLPYLFILVAAECGHPDDCGWRPWPLILLVYAVAAVATVAVRFAMKRLTHKSDRG